MRRTPRPLVPTRGELATALVSGLVAVGLLTGIAEHLSDWHGRLEAAIHERQAREVRIPVLRRPLEPGVVVTAEDVVTRGFPVALLDRDAARDADELVGRTALTRLLAGEPVRRERLSSPETMQGLEAIVPHGLRALQLDLRDEDRVSGFVQAEDRVDVLATLPGDGDRPPETVTLASGVRVLTVDERVLRTPDGVAIHRPQATLAVSPADAERIAATPGGGQNLKLVLWSALEGEPAAPGPVATADLLPVPRLSVREYLERFTQEERDRMVELAHAEPIGTPIVAADEIRDPRL